VTVVVDVDVAKEAIKARAHSAFSKETPIFTYQDSADRKESE
jgi:hypothetical protein